jgi:inner membrane transporter RhtA
MNVSHLPREDGGRRAAGSAALLVVLLGISFQTGSALAVHVIRDVGVVEAAWLRTAFAAVLLAVLALVWRRGQLHLPRRGQRLTLLALSLSLLSMNLCFYAAIERAPVGVVVAIEFLGPLAVAVIGTRRRLDWLWIGLAGGGVALLSSPNGSTTVTGLLLALLSGACWAAYLLLAKHLLTDLDPLVVTTLMIAGAAVFLTPILIVNGARFAGQASTIALAFFVAVASSALPYVLELVALRKVPAATYGVLLSIEPAIAAVIAFLILGQRLAPLEAGGIAAIVLAAAGASWTSGSRGAGLDVPAV